MDKQPVISLSEGGVSMAMFDPHYVVEVMNDILGRRGIELVLTPKEKQEAPQDDNKTA